MNIGAGNKRSLLVGHDITKLLLTGPVNHKKQTKLSMQLMHQSFVCPALRGWNCWIQRGLGAMFCPQHYESQTGGIK